MAGIDPNSGAQEGLPPLLAAILFGAAPDMMHLLIDAGADVNWADEDDFSLLMYALAMGGELPILRILIDSGAAVDARDADGMTALFVAVAMEREKEVIELLLEAGAQVNSKDNDDMTPLVLAMATQADDRIVALLLENGADPNLATEDGINALMFAAILSEDENILHLLLDAGADVFAVSADGITVLDFLAENAQLRNSGAHRRIEDILTKDPALPFSFPEALVPSATNFPTGYHDVITDEVIDSFYMARHETKFSLWKEVYDWATSPDRGDERYYFWHEGSMGRNVRGATTPDHPVSSIVWFDAVNWCNALTEYYNFRNGTDLECVYYNKGVLCRDSRQASIYETIHQVEAMPGHRGFRLPTSVEWDLASRYQDGVNWSPKDFVSGGVHVDDPRAGDYAWFYDNSGRHTNAVGEKLPNALGIYDMSGNVAEFCFDFAAGRDSDDRVLRSNDYLANRPNLWVGKTTWVWPGSAAGGNGFRVVRDYVSD